MQVEKVSAQTAAERGWEICASDPRYTPSVASCLHISSLESPATAGTFVLISVMLSFWAKRRICTRKPIQGMGGGASDPSLPLRMTKRWRLRMTKRWRLRMTKRWRLRMTKSGCVYGHKRQASFRTGRLTASNPDLYLIKKIDCCKISLFEVFSRFRYRSVRDNKVKSTYFFDWSQCFRLLEEWYFTAFFQDFLV